MLLFNHDYPFFPRDRLNTLLNNFTHGMAWALLRNAVAADSTLSATSLAFLKNLIRYIKAIEKSIKNTVKVSLTMISKASAAVSIILIINSKTIFNKRKNIIRKVARVTDLFRTRRDRKPEGVSYKAERERSRLYIKL